MLRSSARGGLAPRLSAAFLMACALLCAAGAQAFGSSKEPRAILVDPPGDDHGPGGYEYPSDPQLYPPGSFDLRRFEVRREGDEVVFEITVGAIIRRPPRPARRTSAEQIPLDNRIYVQNIDIYLDTDPVPGAGFTEAVPGRHVRLPRDQAWDRAVVVTPQPALTASMLSDWEPVSRVVFPTTVSHTGATFTVRVRADQLGGAPEPWWGYAVMISGAQWEPTFNLVGRLALGQSLNAFTIPVFAIAEPESFGGGSLSPYAPWVIDVLTPPGERQERVLQLSSKPSDYVAVSMVYPDPEAYKKERLRRAGAALSPLPSDAVPPGPSVFTRVTDVQQGTVILQRPSNDPAIAPHRMGVVVDKSGAEVAKVVVTTVFPGFVVAQVIEGQGQITLGASVRFDPPPVD